MGAGGSITLINNTACDWNKSSEHSYQMNAWKFPQTIVAGTSCSVYLEYSEHTDKTWTDDGGDVIYQLSDGNSSFFHVKATHPGKGSGQGDISVTFQGMTPLNHADGSPVDLGFVWNGQVVFFLACENATYYVGDIATPYTNQW